MNNITNIKRRAEVARIDEFSKPVVSMFDKKYMKKAHAEEMQKRVHDARVHEAYKKAKKHEQRLEKEWKRTRRMSIACGVALTLTLLANVFGMWGQFFG